MAPDNLSRAERPGQTGPRPTMALRRRRRLISTAPIMSTLRAIRITHTRPVAEPPASTGRTGPDPRSSTAPPAAVELWSSSSDDCSTEVLVLAWVVVVASAESVSVVPSPEMSLVFSVVPAPTEVAVVVVVLSTGTVASTIVVVEVTGS